MNRLWSFGETQYTYDDVTAIHSAPSTVAPNGETIDKDVYSIQFADGKSWYSNLSPCSSSFDKLTPLVNNVSKRSGVKIQKLQVMTKAAQ